MQAAATAGKRVVDISVGALILLRTYRWPGNVRELRNAIEYAVSLTDGDQVTDEALTAVLSCAPDRAAMGSDTAVRQTLRVLQENRWNRTRTARLLGIDRKTLWRRLRKYGVDRPKDN